MKYCIHIIYLAFLIGCSAGETSMDKYAPQDFESNEVMKELNTAPTELDSFEMKQYIKLKIQDLIELQKVLHNPELDDEMKGYAKEMILKTYPDEKLLKKESQIKAYNIAPFINGNGTSKSPIEKVAFGNSEGQVNNWQISLELYQNDTLDLRLHSAKSDNGIKFMMKVQGD